MKVWRQEISRVPYLSSPQKLIGQRRPMKFLLVQVRGPLLYGIGRKDADRKFSKFRSFSLDVTHADGILLAA